MQCSRILIITRPNLLRRNDTIDIWIFGILLDLSLLVLTGFDFNEHARTYKLLLLLFKLLWAHIL